MHSAIPGACAATHSSSATACRAVSRPPFCAPTARIAACPSSRVPSRPAASCTASTIHSSHVGQNASCARTCSHRASSSHHSHATSRTSNSSSLQYASRSGVCPSRPYSVRSVRQSPPKSAAIMHQYAQFPSPGMRTIRRPSARSISPTERHTVGASAEGRGRAASRPPAATRLACGLDAPASSRRISRSSSSSTSCCSRGYLPPAAGFVARCRIRPAQCDVALHRASSAAAASSAALRFNAPAFVSARFGRLPPAASTMSHAASYTSPVSHPERIGSHPSTHCPSRPFHRMSTSAPPFRTRTSTSSSTRHFFDPTSGACPSSAASSAGARLAAACRRLYRRRFSAASTPHTSVTVAPTGASGAPLQLPCFK